MKLITQSLAIILSTLILFVIIQYELLYTAPYIIGLIFIAAIIYALVKKKRKHSVIFSANNLEIFGIMTVVLLVVFLTGGIKSPIFFLSYFLLFGITFIFEPLVIFVFIICATILFGPQVLTEGDVIGNTVKLGSLLILAPIAYFFAREHKKRERLSNQVKMNTEDIIKNAETLINSRDKNERLKKAEQIIDEAKELKKEASD